VVLQVVCLAGMLGLASNASYFYVLGTGQTRLAAILAWATGLVVLGGSLVLVPVLGLMGAGWSNVAAMLIQALLLALMWRRTFGKGFAMLEYVFALYSPVILALVAVAGLHMLRQYAGLKISGWFSLVAVAGCTGCLLLGSMLLSTWIIPGGRLLRADLQAVASQVGSWLDLRRHLDRRT
jgi:O-antigen/teichoic acid export membrane protein